MANIFGRMQIVTFNDYRKGNEPSRVQPSGWKW